MAKMSNAEITPEQVKKIAELSGLVLSEEEVYEFSDIFTDTLEYMDMLNELDTKGVKETYQVTGLTNVFQNGETLPPLSKETALQNANDDVDGYFGTEAVFERE
jgi:aspartyl-tRNA(Asn)/glutamyl-tRNA(Gln) amidotransferase subunit C